MKINEDIKIGDTNTSLGELNTKVNSLTETVLWSGNKKINTKKNEKITLTGMPNLANYQNKIIRFYVGYSGDVAMVKEYYLNAPANPLFLEMSRDYSGNNDIWILLLTFNHINSTSWEVKTDISLQIQGTSLTDLGSYDSYTWTIYKVSVIA